MLPSASGPAVPDMALARGRERFYVEVELGVQEDGKWRNLAALQEGQVAVVAAGPEERKEFVYRAKHLKRGGLPPYQFASAQA